MANKELELEMEYDESLEQWLDLFEQEEELKVEAMDAWMDYKEQYLRATHGF